MLSDLAPIHQPVFRSSLSRRRVTVVALHDGAASAARIAQARDQLQSMFGEVHRMRFYSWAFHHLEALDVRAMAGHVAEESPLFLLACAKGELPPHIQQWLDDRLIEQECHRALLVALANREDLLCSYTERLAARWHTRHLCATQLDLGPERELVLSAIEAHLRPENTDDPEAHETPDDMPLATKKEVQAPAASPIMITEPSLREEIRMRAYHLWLHAGRPLGLELDFWLRAEREFLESQSCHTSSSREQQHW